MVQWIVDQVVKGITPQQVVVCQRWHLMRLLIAESVDGRRVSGSEISLADCLRSRLLCGVAIECHLRTFRMGCDVY